MQATDIKEATKFVRPEDVAWRLLEEVSLEGWRSQGLHGLRPARSKPRVQYRACEVDALICRLRFAIGAAK